MFSKLTLEASLADAKLMLQLNHHFFDAVNAL
jgi:hypothetical protein